MKSVSISVLFAGLAAAHSAVWNITFDGNLYPARDGRFDDELNAKRIEWFREEAAKGNPWQSINDVKSDAITCGLRPRAPAIHAVARAGSNVTVQWSGMIRMHNGPVLNYLGYLPTPTTRPQDVSFFKIRDGGYNKVTKKWVNEEILDNGRRDTFQLPSDIKPGMYIFKTDLVALHGNGMNGGLPKKGTGAGPQFYIHCFNIKILGDGTATPPGVKFPGGYKREDPGIKFSLRNRAAFDSYIIPGPPKYQGKYDAPTGAPPVLTKEERGFFPAAFQAKYDVFKAKEDIYAETSADSFNGVGKQTFAENMQSRTGLTKQLKVEQEALRQEAIKAGITTDAVKAAIPPFNPEGLFAD